MIQHQCITTYKEHCHKASKVEEIILDKYSLPFVLRYIVLQTKHNSVEFHTYFKFIKKKEDTNPQ